MDPSLLAAGFFDAGVGRFLITPGAGGLAAVVAATIAYLAAVKTINSNRDAAALARVQERKADAYVQLIEVSERIGHWAQTVNPATTPPPRKPGKLPKVAEQSAARARLLAFASREVRGP